MGVLKTNDFQDSYGDLVGQTRDAVVSIDNGNSFRSAEDLSEALMLDHWGALVHAMEDKVREKVAEEFDGASCREFLVEYCRLAELDLVIG